MNERQFIRNLRAIVQVQNRKRFDAAEALDSQLKRYVRRAVVVGGDGVDVRAVIDRARQVVTNEAVGVVAGYSPATVEAVLDSLDDIPAEA